MDIQRAPELGATRAYADARGRVTLSHVAPGVLCARTYGFVDGAIVRPCFEHVDELLAEAPEHATRELFLDHTQLTWSTYSTFDVSVRWYRRQRHGSLVCHILTDGLPPATRLMFALARPFTPEGYEPHPTAEGFEAALMERLAC